MENNKQHNAPWFKEINNKGAIIDNYGNLIARADKEEISEFIVTACNSYHSLKQQNEELIEQTAKLQADKDRLAELLKEAIVEYSVQQRHAGYEIIKNQYANAQQRIKQTLSECGYKI